MKNFVTAAVATFSLFAFGATSVSAAIVCNGEGDCWKTREQYKYPPQAGVRVYADDWKWVLTTSIGGARTGQGRAIGIKVSGSGSRSNRLTFPD